VPLATEGKLKLLAVTSPQRSPLLPALPTLREAGVAGVEADAWVGLIAPAGTSEPVLAKIHQQIVLVLGKRAGGGEAEGAAYGADRQLSRSLQSRPQGGARSLGAHHRYRRHQGRVGQRLNRTPIMASKSADGPTRLVPEWCKPSAR